MCSDMNPVDTIANSDGKLLPVLREGEGVVDCSGTVFRISPGLIKLNKFTLNDASFMVFCLIYQGVRFHLHLDGVTSI